MGHKLILNLTKKELKENLIIRNPNSTRPWQFILDVIFGYLLLASKQNNLLEGGWNFGPKKNNINVRKLVTILNSINNFKVRVKYRKNFLLESKYLNLNSSKSKKKLKWKPKYKINEILKLTSEWYNNVHDPKRLKIITSRQISDYLKN